MSGQLFIGAHGTGVPARCVHDHGHSATRKGNVSRCERVLWNNFWAGERVPMRKLSQPQVVMRQGVSGVHHSDAPNNLVLGASFVISNSQSRKGKTDSQSESRCAQIHFSFRCLKKKASLRRVARCSTAMHGACTAPWILSPKKP